MATATKKPGPAAPKPARPAAPEPAGPILRAADAAFHFLASLKLAVLSLLTLATVLAVGTFFEREYGNKALQEYFYKTWWFALLLTLIGTNVLCAALIRYPWKRRQIGFLITHAGLLVLFGGALYSLKVCDEGQVGLVEGQTSSQLVRTEDARIRVRKLDPESGRPVAPEYVLPFRPGAFRWREGRTEVLTPADAPFQVVAKDFLPASAPKFLHKPHDDDHGAGNGQGHEGHGAPMVRLDLRVKRPIDLEPVDPFAGDVLDADPWFIADNKFLRRVKREFGSSGPLPLRLVFQGISAEGQAEKLDDFLNPPQDVSKGLARLHYVDKAGKPRVYEWIVDESTREGEEVTLPDSDVTAAFSKVALIPDQGGAMAQTTGDEEFPVVQFKVRRGTGPALDHFGWWTPEAPSLLPNQEGNAGQEPIVRVGFFPPMKFAEGMAGLKGVVEIAGTADGKFFYRAINSEGVQHVGPLERNKMVTALGGGAGRAMELRLAIDDYIPKGVQEFTYVPVDLPVGQAGNGIPAAKIAMTVGGETREQWVRLPGDLKFNPERVSFPRGDYEIGYDVDRKDMGFTLSLIEFERRFDPGTQQASSFQSEVLLTDEREGIDKKPITIAMNEPLTHRGYTFYQSSFNPLTDRRGSETGVFMSVFAVRKDPAWPVVYIGCLLIVIGAAVQFFMRAGIFTDGGKRERARAAAKAAREGRPAPEHPVAPEPIAELL